MPDTEGSTDLRYPYSPAVDAAVCQALRTTAGIEGFAADMRRQGIHVGLGTPGVCVTCDAPWPCGPSSAS